MRVISADRFISKKLNHKSYDELSSSELKKIRKIEEWVSHQAIDARYLTQKIQELKD
jgi:hypothetical protein